MTVETSLASLSLSSLIRAMDWYTHGPAHAFAESLCTDPSWTGIQHCNCIAGVCAIATSTNANIRWACWTTHVVSTAHTPLAATPPEQRNGFKLTIDTYIIYTHKLFYLQIQCHTYKGGPLVINGVIDITPINGLIFMWRSEVIFAYLKPNTLEPLEPWSPTFCTYCWGGKIRYPITRIVDFQGISRGPCTCFRWLEMGFLNHQQYHCPWKMMVGRLLFLLGRYIFGG